MNCKGCPQYRLKGKQKGTWWKISYEALLQHMKDQNILSTVAVDEDNYVRPLFWQPKLTKNLTYRHHEIFMIDCTYKTNVYASRFCMLLYLLVTTNFLLLQLDS